MVSVDDLLASVDRAFDGMLAVVEQLGDELVNRRPEVEGANTPYVLVTHCVGVVEFWVGGGVAGRPVERDREAEFHATGSVPDLVAQVRRARARLHDDLVGVDPSDGRAATGPATGDRSLDPEQGRVLLHVLVEVAQHLGQLEVTRDVLLAPWVRTAPQAGTDDRLTAAAGRGLELVRLAVDGRWEELRRTFDDRMLAVAPVTTLVDAWSHVSGSLGTFRGLGRPNAHLIEGRRAVDVPLAFERGSLVGRVALDEDGAVAGLWFLRPDAVS